MMQYQGTVMKASAGRAINFFLTALALLYLTLFAARPAFARSDLHYPDYITVPNTPIVQVGQATAERLGSIFDTGAGPYATAHSGDWRLSNEHIHATFCSTDDTSAVLRHVSMPTNGYQELPPGWQRYPGALIDLAVDGNSLDFLLNYTQFTGGENNSAIVIYDTILPVKRAGAVGLQLEGSPFENSPVRLRTTYWLASGSYRLQIETLIMGVPEGEALPQVCDMGAWGDGALLIDKIGVIFGAARRVPMETDFFQVQGGNMAVGVAGAEGTIIKGSYSAQPSATRAYYIPAEESNFGTSDSQPLFYFEKNSKPAAEKDGRTSPSATQKAQVAKPRKKVDRTAPIRRDLWVMKGNFSDLVQKIQEDRKIPTGTLTGIIAPNAKGRGLADARLRIQRIDRARLQGEPAIYTIVKSDQNGRFTIKLPEGFYFLLTEPKSLYQTSGGMRSSARMSANKTKTINIGNIPESGVRIKVVDAATSRPLSARLRIEAIPPTQPFNFGFPLSSDGYVDNIYIPSQGGDVYLPPGHWIIYANHGISYDNVDRDVRVVGGKMTPLMLPLKQSSPTPGWAHLEIGVRTKATPGCMIEPRDIVRMAEAEGISWIVSGDYEKLTDLKPFITALGLAGQVGASRGFRTTLPAHPEWGQFLIYPVKDDAPDPAAARQQWAGLKTAKEFIATLRKLYPGALIQSDLPYTDKGLGYFARKDMDAYEISDLPNPDIELGIDAVNIFPARTPWDIKMTKGFLFTHMIHGRFYLPVGANSATNVFGAEPGYPRLLAYLGKGAVNEETVFEALKGHRVQLTSGPFIDFNINGNIPGGMCDLDKSYKIHLRVTAPKWVDTGAMSIDKESNMKTAKTLGAKETMPLRFPFAGDDQLGNDKMTLGDLEVLSTRDTLISVSVYGNQSLRPWLPSSSPRDEVMPFAIIYPIQIDGIKNGKYDPLPSFGDMGT